MNTKNKNKFPGINLGPDVDLKEIEKNDTVSSRDDLTEEDFEDSNVKVKISMWMDKKLLLAIKDAANHSNKKYQSLMQEKLSEVFLGHKDVNSRLEELEQRLHAIENKSA